MSKEKEKKIAVIGLGYVGLPLALALARKYAGTIGFDINSAKISKIRDGVDVLQEGLTDALASTTLEVTDKIEDLRGCNFFIVVTPTPVDENHRPDLRPLRAACESVGMVMGRGATIVFESTVYPGVTDDICAPILERVSGLTRGIDFKLGYSPERMNPGDRERTVETITKVVAGEDAESLDEIAEVYESVVTAGVHRAPTIKVAEAAKVIENTQRDLNIALMNELAIIFDRLDIRTVDVLEAAGTKWNFLPFRPGLVGGHCIGVDPYYLTTKAEQVGYHPQVILAGRRINDGMGAFVAQRLVKLMANECFQIKGARIGVLGLTFKENVADMRNSRVPDIINELCQFGITPLVDDPLVDPEEALHEYGIRLEPRSSWSELDGLVVAVAHADYQRQSTAEIAEYLKPGGIIVDVKSMIDSASLPEDKVYWSL